MTRPSLFPAIAALLIICCTFSSGCGGSSSSTPSPNPVPTISSLSTSSVHVGDADLTLSVLGTGFTSDTQLIFGSTALLPSSKAPSQLSVVVPKSLFGTAGIVPITAMNPAPGGGSSNAVNFTIGNPVPEIAAFAVSSTLVNSTDFTLAIDGHGFTSDTRVHFGSDVLTPATIAESRIAVPIPNNLLTTARIVPVGVTNPEPMGGTSNSLNFSINNPVPTISALSVESAEAGAEADLALSVTGTNFVSGATVEFGPTRLTPAAPNSDRLDVMVPAAAMGLGAQIAVTVTNPEPGGGSSQPVTFRLNNPVPQLTALSQTTAVTGDPAFQISLSGAKFLANTVVDFGGTLLTPSSTTKNQMMVTIPETSIAAGGIIEVKAMTPEPGGGSSAPISFTVNNPVPSITALSPTSITDTGADVAMTITGANFFSFSSVAIGDQPLTSSVLSRSAISITIPAALVKNAASTGSFSLSVSNPSPAGGASNAFGVTVHKRAALTWETAANGSRVLPGTTTPFATFGPPTVNASGLTAFRGVSAVSVSDGTGESSTTTGIYTVDLANGGTLEKVADIATVVPDPNTQTYGQSLAKFGGFPSPPLVSPDSRFVGFNATHPPVVLLADGKGGGFGLYSNLGGSLNTGVGAFVATSTATYPYFQVPKMATGTAFGAFPASPTPVGGNTLVFKGDYLNGTAVGMGLYYRDVVSENGQSPVSLIAATSVTAIPNSTRKFGYLGIPGTAASTVVFVGYDRKDAATMGGIYSAPIASEPQITALVNLGMQVPGEDTGVVFTGFADNLSFDGRFVGFWGSWGSATTTRTLSCSDVPDAALAAVCSSTVYPTGSTTVEVPVHQGFFLYDTTQQTLAAVAKTGSDFRDFASYTFVGVLPEEGPSTEVGSGSTGGGGETEVPLEPQGFVLSPRIAVAGQSGTSWQAAFMANTGGVNGIYIATSSGQDSPAIATALDTTMVGTDVDYMASGTTRIRTLELDPAGMRGSWLAIGSTLFDSTTQSTSQGVYYTQLSSQ